MYDTLLSGNWLAGKQKIQWSTERLLSSTRIFSQRQHCGSCLSFTVTLSWISSDLLLVMLIVIIVFIFCFRDCFCFSGLIFLNWLFWVVNFLPFFSFVFEVDLLPLRHHFLFILFWCASSELGHIYEGIRYVEGVWSLTIKDCGIDDGVLIVGWRQSQSMFFGIMNLRIYEVLFYGAPPVSYTHLTLPTIYSV